MNAIQNFAFEEHLVRVVDIDGTPWFVGKDVCGALGIRNHNDALSDLDEDERGVAITDPPRSGSLGGGSQESVVVSEPGVYRLVFRSRKPEAERFKRWLAHDVLPQIRRTGRYAPEAAPVAAPETGPVAELRARLDMVREARILFGPARAARLWSHLGLPEVPPLVEGGREEAAECLAHLLACEVPAGPVRGMLDAALGGDETAQAALRDCGLRVPRSLDGAFVASSHPGMAALFAGSRWAGRGWYRALLGLPGAVRGHTMKFGGNRASHSLFLPLELLDPA